MFAEDADRIRRLPIPGSDGRLRYRAHWPTTCAPDYADGGVGRTVCSTPEGALNVICGTGP